MLSGCCLLRSDCSKLLEVLLYLVFGDEVHGYFKGFLSLEFIVWSLYFMLLVDELEIEVVQVKWQSKFQRKLGKSLSETDPFSTEERSEGKWVPL